VSTTTLSSPTERPASDRSVPVRATLKKDERVLKSSEFRRALQKGRRFRSSHLTLIAFLKHFGKVRLGLTVSRKVGNAVVRNRIKRRLREIVRLQRRRFSRPWDLVIIAQPGAGELSSQALWEQLKPALDTLARQELGRPDDGVGSNASPSQDRSSAGPRTQPPGRRQG